jgi:hypothetical protein
MLEVLHGVGDKQIPAIDPGVSQRTIQHAAGRADERQAGPILMVAGLLADQHHRGASRSLAGHRLGGVLVKRTAPAPVFRGAQP